MTREWFTTYCQNAAANVLDRDGKVRFDYSELKTSLDAASEHRAADIEEPIMILHDNIMKLCNARHEHVNPEPNNEYALLLTLLNIHAAYLMVSGLWREEPKPQQEGGVDEYGFEIF